VRCEYAINIPTLNFGSANCPVYRQQAEGGIYYLISKLRQLSGRNNTIKLTLNVTFHDVFHDVIDLTIESFIRA